MGAITGKPKKEQIARALHSYAQCGMDQFLIYPRSGCELSYMSQEWLDTIRAILDAAKNEGMKIWLYDEFNWPSGSCGGKVMQTNPDFYARGVFIENEKCEVKIYDSYADILNPDAVDCFIENTHEVYHRHFGEYFGSVIQGIFTDEPEIFRSVRGGATYPYTKNIEVFYHDVCGRNLWTDMLENPNHPVFLDTFWSLLKKMFRENFIDRINHWCVDHGILLTGHLFHEHDIRFASQTSGSTIYALRGFTLPGMDEIHTKTSIDTAEWLTLGSVEAAARVTRRGALGELFAYGPSDIPPARMEQMLFLEAAFKIDHYVMAVSAFDAKGNTKKYSWYHPTNYTSPWFEGYTELGKSAKRAAQWAKKDIASEVFVRLPIRDAIRTKNTPFNLHERLNELLKALVRNQYQWQLLDEEEEAPENAYTITVPADDSYSLDSVLEKLFSSLPRTFAVYEGEQLAEEIFVRRYTDGTYMLLDLRDTPDMRHLTVVDKDSKTHIDLNGRGHYLSSDPLPPRFDVISSESPTFSFSLLSENTLRCNLHPEKDTFSFFVKDTLAGISVSVRDHEYDGQVYLDEKLLSPTKECTCMTRGLNELYRTSASFTLSPGMHTIRVTDPPKYSYFLPVCIISGSFAATPDHTLRALPTHAKTGYLHQTTLPQYAGHIVYETDISIPSDAEAVFLDSAELYTRLRVDGESLGAKISDYVWSLPPQMRGKKCRFTIRQYTSIAPLFGDYKEALSLPEQTPGRYELPYKKCGIAKINFLKEMK